MATTKAKPKAAANRKPVNKPPKPQINRDTNEPKPQVDIPKDDVFSSSVMRIHLRIGMWTARKHEEEVEDETRATHEVEKGYIRTTGKLLEDKALSSFSKVATKARNALDRVSLPWSDDGWRVIASTQFSSVAQELAECENLYEAAWKEWENGKYQQEKDRVKANNRRGKIYREEDYPSLAELRPKFYFDYDIEKVAMNQDFRWNLGQEASEAEHALLLDKATKTLQENTRIANQTAWWALMQPIADMTETLSEYGTNDAGKIVGKFTQSIVNNITKQLEVAESWNASILQDANLTAFIQEIRQELTLYSAEKLREDDELRHSVADKAQEIIDRMEAYLL